MNGNNGCYCEEREVSYWTVTQNAVTRDRFKGHRRGEVGGHGVVDMDSPWQ